MYYVCMYDVISDIQEAHSMAHFIFPNIRFCHLVMVNHCHEGLLNWLAMLLAS